MRVMWVCNIPVMKGKKTNEVRVFEGWISAMAKLLRERLDMELMICYPQSNIRNLIRTKSDGIIFSGFYVSDWHLYDQDVYEILKKIEKSFSPDVIHIFGTEFPHTLSAMKLNPDKTLVDIQGLIGIYAKHYFTGLPASLTTSISAIFFGKRISPVYQDMVMLKKRGRYERAALKRAKYVTGRTEWDYACVKTVNPKIEYFECNRVLRENFYHHEWDYENCERHSIFISQADYPIKGFHIFLQALRILLTQYTDIQVSVAGRPLCMVNPEAGTYDAYIKRYMEHYHMQKHVKFVGILDETQMCDRYLRTNVVVVPSLIENAPNSLGEAMIMGVPCVASNVGGVSGMLSHGLEGFLYQSDAGYMLAHYVAKIFDDSQLAQKLSENAKKRARVTHDRRKNVNDLVKIYSKIQDRNM